MAPDIRSEFTQANYLLQRLRTETGLRRQPFNGYRQVKLRVAAYPREFIYYSAAAHFQDTKARIRSIR